MNFTADTKSSNTLSKEVRFKEYFTFHSEINVAYRLNNQEVIVYHRMDQN